MSADNFNYVRCRSDGRWDVWVNLSASCSVAQELRHREQPNATFNTQDEAVEWADAQGYTEYGTEVEEYLDPRKDATDAIRKLLEPLSENDRKAVLEYVLENRCRTCLDYSPSGDFWCCYDSRGD